MAESRRGVRQAMASLQYPDYRRFAASLLLTQIGAQLIQTAIFWQVYVITDSELQLGLTGLARAVPHMILSMMGGVIADRVNRVRLIQVGQVLNGLLVLGLVVLTYTGTVEVWHLYLVTVLNASFSAATQPARTALIPSLVPANGLVNAIALQATISQSSQIIGPALAGLAIGLVDLGPTYLLNGLLYLLAMVVIMGIRNPAAKPESTEDSPWQSFVEGLSFVTTKRVMLWLMLLDTAAMVFGSYRALLPIFADRLGVGEIGYGLLSAAPGVGAVLGAMLMLGLGDIRYKGLYVVAGVVAYCASLMVLAVSPWFWLALVGSALLGITNSIQTIPRNTTILSLAPNAMRGRVESFRSMLAGGTPPLGYALSGVVAGALGAPVALVIGAIAGIATASLIGASSRALRERDLGQRPLETTPAPRGAPALDRASG